MSDPQYFGGDVPFERFFLPGPTAVRGDVLQAQTGQMIGHRGPDIQTLMGEIQIGLREVFRTRSPVLVSTSSATGFMEAGIRNAARNRVLALVNGAFSDRFAKIGEACGFAVDRMEVPWGEAHDPAAVASRLETGDYDAVTVVHSETSTGVLNPIHELAGVVNRALDVVLLVDSVTGVGGAPMEGDAWQLDYVLTGSQKAMALPPGLAFALAGPRVMERSASATRKGVYFDLQAFAANLEKNQTPNTPAVSLLYSLHYQMGRMRAETMEGRWARHEAMRDRCVAWVDEMREGSGVGIEVLAPEGYRSPTVTCISLPEGMAGSQIARGMRDAGFVIAPGYGKLKDSHIRIGHMGDHTLDELNGVLAQLEEIMGV